METSKVISTYCKHPGCILYFTGIRLDIAVIECAARVHVYLVIVPQMGYQKRDISNSRTLRSSIWAIVWSKVTLSLMFKFAVVRENLYASQEVILAGQFKWLRHLLQCQTPNISKLLSTSGAPVLYPCFTGRTQCMSIVALQKYKVSSQLFLAELRRT